VPILLYEDLQPYIWRIADDDRSPILSGSGHPVFKFLTISGTSDSKRKHEPVSSFPYDGEGRGCKLLLQILGEDELLVQLDWGPAPLLVLAVCLGR
jgi:hypothetical protein